MFTITVVVILLPRQIYMLMVIFINLRAVLYELVTRFSDHTVCAHSGRIAEGNLSISIRDDKLLFTVVNINSVNVIFKITTSFWTTE